jgi:hypothetical protein
MAVCLSASVSGRRTTLASSRCTVIPSVPRRARLRTTRAPTAALKRSASLARSDNGGGRRFAWRVNKSGGIGSGPRNEHSCSNCSASGLARCRLAWERARQWQRCAHNRARSPCRAVPRPECAVGASMNRSRHYRDQRSATWPGVRPPAATVELGTGSAIAWNPPGRPPERMP